MKNNLIPFPKFYQRSEKRVESLAPSEELKALRTAFDEARANRPIEMAELPENNKIYCGSKK